MSDNSDIPDNSINQKNHTNNNINNNINQEKDINTIRQNPEEETDNCDYQINNIITFII
jgi:hypothetical protein